MDDILPNDVINKDLNYYSKLLQTFDSKSNNEEVTDEKQSSEDFLNSSHKKHKVKKSKKFSDSISHPKNETQKRLSQEYSPKKDRNRKDSNSAESNFSSSISVEGSFNNDIVESSKKKKRKKNKISGICNVDVNLASQESRDEEIEEKSKKKKKHKEFSEIPHLEDFISYTEIKEERCSSSSHNEMEPFDMIEESVSDKHKSKRKEKVYDVGQRRYNEDTKYDVTDTFTYPHPLKKKKTKKLHKISDSINTENENEFSGNNRKAVFKENIQLLEKKEVHNSANEMEEFKTIKNGNVLTPTAEGKTKTRKCNDTENSDQSDFELDIYSSDNESVIDFEDIIDKALEQKQIEIQSYDNMLQHLFIVVDWEIPEAHMFEKSITSCPKRELQRRIKLSGIDIKRGVYSQEEDKSIKANWEAFAEIYSISDPSVFFSFKRKGVVLLPLEERIKFAQFLGRGLTNRLLFSIYQRFRVLYSDINKGRFNKYENQIILTFLRSKLAKDSSKFSKLAKVLNRDRIALAKHSEILLSEHEITDTVKWNLENMEKLLKSLLNNMGMSKVKKLKKAKISSEVWKLVSNDLHVPPKKLRYVWECKLYPRLFIKENLDTNVVVQIILKQLHENRVSDWKLINWENLASLFPGVTPTWVNKFIRDFLRHHVPNRKEKPLQEIVGYLLSLVNNTGEFDCNFCSNLHRPLVMLKFKNGRLFQAN